MECIINCDGSCAVHRGCVELCLDGLSL
jgi:hypothetical protein